MSQPIRKAVFPVAGMGTRFLPATKAVPKEMLPVVDKPLIQYAVEEARAAGIDQIIFVTAGGKGAIEDHFDHHGPLEDQLRDKGKDDALADILLPLGTPGEVIFTRQQEPLGLGHAVWCARHLVGAEPFAVILPDDMVLGEPGCMRQMVDAFAKTGGNLVAVEDVPRAHTNRYGILDPGAESDRLVEVRGLVEKPDPADAPSTLSVIGRYVLLPEIFDHLARQERGAGGEIQLTDAMARMIGAHPFHGLRFAGRRFDCGDKVGFLEANIAYALDRPDMAASVRRLLAEALGAGEPDQE